MCTAPNYDTYAPYCQSIKHQLVLWCMLNHPYMSTCYTGGSTCFSIYFVIALLISILRCPSSKAFTNEKHRVLCIILYIKTCLCILLNRVQTPKPKQHLYFLIFLVFRYIGHPNYIFHIFGHWVKSNNCKCYKKYYYISIISSLNIIILSII